MNVLELLEFPRIRDHLARQCRCDDAAGRVRELVPDTDRENMVTTGRRVMILLRLLQEGHTLPGTSVGPLEGVFDRVRVSGAVPEPEAFLVIRHLLDHAAEWEAVPAILEENDLDSSPILEVYTPGGVPTGLHDELRTLIERDGTIREEAIPEAARLRSTLTGIRGEIRSTAASLIRENREIYREDVPTIRDGRTVLPLRADFKGRVDGIIHEASGSGDTLFVEPTSLVDLNNSGVRAEAEIHMAIHRRLRELSDSVRIELEAIERLATMIIDLDLLAARARYGLTTRGTILPVREEIDLRGARHPLLGDSCVPLHIRFGPGIRLLVISGPNTGGKTVLLKTLGLLAVMHQCSIPVPAEADSALPVFSHFSVSIGDEQSIDEALSTFSAHIRSLAEIATEADSGSLVLLDELAGGTDPEEGAALAMALVDHLLEVGATILVTTHLTVLKHYGYTRDGAANAAMEFDESTHRPTFRVVPGQPGSSHALDTARRYGLPEPVLVRAEEYLGDRSGSVGEILRRLQEEERLQRELRAALDRERSELAARRDDLQTRAAELDDREIALRTEGVRRMERDLAEARSTIESEVRRLREKRHTIEDDEIRKVRTALHEAEELSEHHRRELEQMKNRRPAAAAPVQPTHLVEGRRFRHRRSGKTGTVRSVRGKKVELQFDTIRMTVPVTELEHAARAEDETASVAIDTNAARSGASAKLELDLRGYRQTEAITALEEQLDAAILQHISRFSVIHGTGTGVLRKSVQEYLRTRPEVSSFTFAPPDQGGFGKTVVELVQRSG